MRNLLLSSAVCGILVGCAHGGNESRRREAPIATASSDTPVAPTSGDGVAARASASPASLRLPLAGGRAVVVDGDDHVVIVEADGGAGAESWCGANGISYARAAAFLSDVARHVKAHDKDALAALVQFPLHARIPVKSRAEFLRKYEQIVTAEETAAIARADPGEVFCRNGAFMLGNGEIWAEPDASGAYRIITINPPISRRRKHD